MRIKYFSGVEVFCGKNMEEDIIYGDFLGPFSSVEEAMEKALVVYRTHVERIIEKNVKVNIFVEVINMDKLEEAGNS